MARLLIVHHTVSPTLEALLESVIAGANAEEIEGVDVEVQPALTAGVTDVLSADGFILGTPANIGYMSGALKHFFDQVYYPCRRATARSPYGLYTHGGGDTSGAVRSVTSIATGMGWQPVCAPVVVLGSPDRAALDACWELGATVAASLLPG